MYRTVFSLVGAAATALGIVLMFAPETYLDLYLLAPQDGRGFAARRLSAVVIALGVVLILVRDLPPGLRAVQFAVLTACVWFAIAATGLYAYITGTANSYILIASVSEAILGVLFLICAQKARRAPGM